ncbi:siphovirus ReqiPepy6 Gp37-like family protein [Micromonospora tarapacensis]|uniref:siphovirus ReqiPepy6 Gp37-like family protein n=1 Tax=Micromonospora tarapacensis TaxID=2835305 RepID=UPI001E2F005F|nr:siphovirus ReqiPepy6 Gp37-like family protein [Micromonospora tarapacensis]
MPGLLDTEVTITDRHCVPVTNPIRYVEVDAEIRFNAIVAGSVIAPAYAELTEALLPGHRVVIRDQGAIFKSGPIEGLDFVRTATGPDAAGRWMVDFGDDGAHLANRITYPDPSIPATEQTVDAQWTGTGPAGTLILDLVDDNGGPAALTARRVPQLVIGDGAGLGATLTYASRFQDLYVELRALAVLGGTGVPGGELGFRVRQVDRDLVAEVYAPRDRTGFARFSFATGTLRQLQVTTEAPTCTVAIVAGEGRGTDRTIVERVDAAAVATWWRSEEFVDAQNEADTEQLEHAGDETLDGGREQLTITTETVDTPQVVYGDAYTLGDLALVLPGPTTPVTDIVRAVRLQVVPRTGRVRTALIGTQAAATDPAWVAGNRTLARRAARTERI